MAKMRGFLTSNIAKDAGIAVLGLSGFFGGLAAYDQTEAARTNPHQDMSRVSHAETAPAAQPLNPNIVATLINNSGM